MDNSTVIPKRKFLFSQKELPSVSFQMFIDMRLKGDLCDVTFVVENVKVLAHRLVLAANIPYFHDMFVNSTTESCANEITLQNIEPSALETLIYFAYNCELNINEDNVKSLLIGASFLQMDEVTDVCHDFILEGMNPDNALEIQEFAAAYNLTRLKDSTEEFIQNHFFEISHSSAFLELPFSDFKKMLEKDEICVPSEEVVYQAALAWVKRSLEDREERLPELLTAVRMPFLGYNFLSACITSEVLIQKSPTCQKLVHEAKDHCILSYQTPCSFSLKPRKATDYKNSCVGNYIYTVCRLKKGGVTPTAVERYDLVSGKWQMMNAQTAYIKDAAVVAMGKSLYVIGGHNSINRVLASMLMYDSVTDSWSEKASLKEKKHSCSAAVCSDKIYVCGGVTDKGTVSRDVECYCHENDEWISLPHMLMYRYEACSVSVNGYIYVLGGIGTSSGMKAVVALSSGERYDPEVEQWVEISCMSTTHCLRSAAYLNGKIYIHGEKYVEVYDPYFDEWDCISKVKEDKKGCFTLLAFSDKLYALGGSGSRTVYIYDPVKDEWNEAEPFPVELNFVGAGKISVL